ncbi:MAG: ATP synthase F1 subunit gamma [Planctomycetes bacterium]|nr:ATP synthase F1 subunit gamma [Planctomycetota bacterium]
MAKTREIKRRIRAVGNIKRITKTMQMIATARFQAAFRRASAAQPYTRKIAELVGELAATASAGGTISHPLLKSDKPATGRKLLLVIASNRGLCGGYNANILRVATAFLRDNKEAQIDLEIVGKKAQAYFKFIGRPVAKSYTQFGDNPRYEDVVQLADQYMQLFTAGGYDSIDVISMGFISMAKQTPKAVRLLPLENPAAVAGEKAPAASVQYDFSPEPTELLNELLPITVKTQLFQCFNEAVVGEQIARMVAMKAATDSAGKMGKELTRRYNRARQSAITTELSEIIAGAAALE